MPQIRTHKKMFLHRFLGLITLVVMIASVLSAPLVSRVTQAAPAAPVIPGDPTVVGAWGPVTALTGLSGQGLVAIHTSLLPNGKVLLWTRQQDAGGGFNAENFSFTYVWDPATATVTSEPFNGVTNLFCSGHAFLYDGRLLVTGGHMAADGRGEPDTNIYDFNTNAWTQGATMGRGRWYPTNVALGNGELLVANGSDENFQFNPQSQVWTTGNTWRALSAVQNPFTDTYPWLHVAPNGQVFHSGPGQATDYLRTSGTGQLTFVQNNVQGERPYGSSVVYDDGKVLIMGGAGASMGTTPRNSTEMINLNKSAAISTTITPLPPAPAWRRVGDMNNPRRQLNATVLPDGKVLVTGGTSTGGFSDPVGSVLEAEMYDPNTEVWTRMADMAVRRLYHSTAILLPDGRVFSAGGGFGGGETNHFDYEMYSPPYLFKGPRPTVTSAPTVVNLNEQFFIATPDAASISQVTMVRLGSVTHAFNQNQRISNLSFHQAAGGLNVQTPGGGNLCPPGHYMLFALNSNGVPSVARIIKVTLPTNSNNSINDSSYIVRMHYEDFLGRDPISAGDRGGMVFWTRQITQCGNDQACRDIKRADVSDAFWQSGDFRARADVIADGLVNPSGNPMYNNHQFVRYCYRMYLRREPDASGWQFWENTLNGNNNYKNLMKAFIGSGEYRGRFHNP